MATTTNKTATKNSNSTRSRTTTGKAQTPSGRGVVNPGRRESRNGNGDNNTTARNTRPTNKDVAPFSSVPPPGWWKDIGDASRMSERDRRRMSAAAHTMGDHLHSVGDFLYSPEVGDLPARGRIEDRRLYQGASEAGNGRNKTVNGNGTSRTTSVSNGNTRNGNGKNAATKSATTKATSRSRGE